MYGEFRTLRGVRLSSTDDFQTRFYAAATQLEKVKLCIREERYKIVVRRDKPNLFRVEYLKAILDLPSDHPHKVKSPRLSGEAGSNFVIDFDYQADVAGTEVNIYFKGYFGTEGTLKLVVQSLRTKKDE